MAELIVDIVGSCAATLTTVAFLPQTIRIFRTKDTAAISLAMYLTFSTGVLCWLFYGLMLVSWPIIIANVITFGLCCAILAMKLRDVLRRRVAK